ncbi:hypothetical protein N7510_008817 [Penicillium lagena]|uniref:uncharacterized protein n=1 Tax=Penicillium lagena TaxID=94218 RepID=UPI0025406F06|nr:uncharacterized protein N7510_008817 [Penicillium lagena]KAJ5606036.1 hypothetical protein N7510_008817 [Penicillium lagena]
MSTPEESPAQRAARLRRERRETKIRDGGSQRLNKITSLAGRKPQPPSLLPPAHPHPPAPQIRPSPSPQPDMQSAESLRAQQEAFRALLRQSAPEPGQDQQQPGDMPEDPTIKLLNSLLGAMPGDPNAAPPPGAPPQPPGQQPPGLSPADIASALGVPPYLANMLGGKQPPTEQEQKRQRVLKTLHVLFAVVVSVYLLFVIGKSVATFGFPPPKPATAQNPWTVFVTGELVLSGGRVLLAGKQGGLGMAVQLVRDVIRDGSLVLFVLGMGTWYHSEWQTAAVY